MTRSGTTAARRHGFGIAGLLVALLLVGGAATGGWYAARHATRDQRIRDGAAIIAEHGLREFADNVSVLALLDMTIGFDSIMHRARIFGDDENGMIAVQVTRTDDLVFHVKSTGRLATNGAPFICSYDVTWNIERETDPRRALEPNDGPLCNGAKRRRPPQDSGLLDRLGR